MSMLGEQSDELRTLADKLRSVRFDDRANYIENVETLYLSMRAMREAADTIEGLRDKLQGCECDVVKSYGKHPVTNNDVVLYNCSKCGKWIGLSANYCGNCGARIRKTVDA